MLFVLVTKFVAINTQCSADIEYNIFIHTLLSDHYCGNRRIVVYFIFGRTRSGVWGLPGGDSTTPWQPFLCGYVLPDADNTWPRQHSMSISITFHHQLYYIWWYCSHNAPFPFPTDTWSNIGLISWEFQELHCGILFNLLYWEQSSFSSSINNLYQYSVVPLSQQKIR